MNTRLETLRELPSYLAPIHLAQRAQPLLDALNQLNKRLKKVRKRAQKHPEEMNLVWRVESEIRDLLKKHRHQGVCRLSQTEFRQTLQGWSAEEQSLENQVSFWDELSVGSVISHFRELAIAQTHRPILNPYRDAEYDRLLRTLTAERPRWKLIAQTLHHIAQVQRQKVGELQQMFHNIQTHNTPHELDAWVSAIEAVTPGIDNPYATLREVAYWLTDGFGLIGYWAQKHLWERTETQERNRKYTLVAVEFLSASAVIATSIITRHDSLIGDVARGIAMPFMACLPYIAYISYRIREVSGGLPKDMKRVTWQFRAFYTMLWIMMIGPYLLHRWLPQMISEYTIPWGRDKRLRQALKVYVDALLGSDRKGHVLADMLKARHQLVALRRRFEVIPLTVLSELSDDARYIVIDLAQATPEGRRHWCEPASPTPPTTTSPCTTT